MDNRRGFILFLLLFFLLTAPGPHPPSPVSEREHRKELAEERRALSLLNSSSYGDFDVNADRWIPLTGLTKADGYAWGLLAVVQDIARKQLQLILGGAGASIQQSAESANNEALDKDTVANFSLPVYRNVTGRVRGDWVRRKNAEAASRPQLNLTSIVTKNDYFTRDFGRNVTSNSGRLVMDLHEDQGRTMSVEGSHVREIKAEMAMHSDQDSWLVPLYGVHYPLTGGIVMSTTSEKFAGLSSLPHFALSKDTYELSRQLLNRSLSEALLQKQSRPTNFLPWSSLPHGSSAVTFPAPNCEYIVYLQQHRAAVHGMTIQEQALDLIEQELRFPTGAPIPTPPPMVMSAVMFSPDCGFVLESKGPSEFPPTENLYLVGLKREIYGKYTSRFIIIIAAILGAQIMVLMRQMKESSTPSTRSRVSFYTIAMMSLGDGLLMSYMLPELYTDTSFLLITATSFLSFFGVSFLGMKFQIEIWTIQAPERMEREQQAANNAEELPRPVTAQGPADANATPVASPPDQNSPANTTTTNTTPRPPESVDTAANAGAMYSRFYFVLFCLIFLSSWALFWSPRVRTIYVKTLSFVYLSFWTPQIYRNVMRNCRKALSWEFVIGESLLRLFPYFYFYLSPRNVLLIQSDLLTTFLLGSWVWIQVWALISQDILGPRFFVPKGWVPPAYDYHPILRDTSVSGSGEDPEAGETLPITSLRAEQREVAASAGENNREAGSGKRKRIFDCAICMQDIEVSVIVSDGSIGAGSMAKGTSLFTRRAYMVTPCCHIFHSQCLETWMRLRLQCPICRESIPPL